MSEKSKAILAYIFGVLGGLIVLFGVKDNSKNTKMHAGQAIVASGLCMLVGALPFVAFVSAPVYLIVMILGIIKVNKEEDPELPLIGELTTKIFGKYIND